MSKRNRNWLVGISIFLGVVILGLFIAASVLRRRFEPYIREQAIAYLEKRFDSDVNLASLHIHIPPTSPLHLLFTGGRGVLARVDGTGLALHQKAAPNLPPILVIKSFSFAIDLGAVFDSPHTVNKVVLQGMVVSIPPKEQRTPLSSRSSGSQGDSGEDSSGVIVQEVVASNSQLLILPRIQGKEPLTFDLASIDLKSVGKDVAMTYTAVLTNPRPKGLIHSTGTFGPWAAGEPGDTPLKGNYTFDNADLGVFSAIAGILHSTGDFEGTLSSINARGTASVPDFRLKSAGNPVPLTTTFEVLVDGSNGNTVLQPVKATLGTTDFTTSGVVLKKEGDPRRTISLDVSMPKGNLTDVLKLAMKGDSFMEGTLAMKSKIDIPPLTGKVKEKLILDGHFTITDGRFLRSQIQSKIDALSRRAQGQPNNEEITQVVSVMNGSFHMEDQTISFRTLTFGTPGAEISLAGNYNTAADALDFHGTVGLDAKVSQTMTGWKRWALKPVDPFFAKNGVGTFLHIKIDGSSKSPNFGLDHGKPDQAPEQTAQSDASSGGGHSKANSR